MDFSSYLESFEMALHDFFTGTSGRFLIPILVFLLAFFLAKFIRKLFDTFFDKSSSIIQNDPTNYHFIKHFFSAIIYVTAFFIVIYSIPSLRGLALSLFAGAGIFAAIIGFASQQAFSNIISGIFIVIFKPFRVKDRIQIGETHSGTVEDITLRHTVIRNFENRRIVIPNSVISSQTVINSNMVDDKICRFIEVQISYESDIPLAMRLMQECALKHPLLIDNRSEEDKAEGKDQVMVRVAGFADSGVQLRAFCWVSSPMDAFALASDLFQDIKVTFQENGIEIPYPHRTVVEKKP